MENVRNWDPLEVLDVSKLAGVKGGDCG
jgi:hypothetical protein